MCHTVTLYTGCNLLMYSAVCVLTSCTNSFEEPSLVKFIEVTMLLNKRQHATCRERERNTFSHPERIMWGKHDEKQNVI